VKALLNDNRFTGVIALVTLTYVLVEYVRERDRKTITWLREYVTSPRAVFARSRREQMIAAENDCGCPDGSN
jgi:hypothetical protein